MYNTSYLENNLFVGLFRSQKVLQAATWDWQEDSGTQTGSPTKGTTRTTGVTDVNWKNSGTQGTAYSAAPITAGNNSFDKWQFGKFTGTFNQVLTVLFAHTSVALGTGLTLKGPPACTGDGDRLLYTTPTATANANLSNDMTTAISIASGVAVCVGATGPEATGKAASGTANPLYTSFFPTQLQTTSSAVAGDTAVPVITCQYLEN